MENTDSNYSQGRAPVSGAALPLARQGGKKIRMRKPVQLIVLLCASLAVGSALAVPINVLGFDDMSCTAWVNSKSDEDQRRSYLVWMRGVLTGHNYGQQSQQVSTISSGTIEMFVDRYCKLNPKDQFSEAVFRLSDQFSGRNQPIKK